ncbi:hydroxymethylcytosylglucuronate/cytosylglucuronate synthase [Streptomyces sp. NPDC048416]|uniref:hydroxymethylcytosylglucuronate/cytosylglucurona te synthase n=1 Tax=Streptomyces sp. NPDC048416 TaxID=3365546 RepID=UPI0037187427
MTITSTTARDATASGSTAPTVALCGVEFGWGSAGKLGAVIDALRARLGDDIRFVGIGSRLGRDVVRGYGVTQWHDVDVADRRALRALVEEQSIDVALCVLDRATAVGLEEAGCPVVFVDSLPFLWTEEDLAGLPLRAAVYCAQLCPGLPGPAWPVMARVENLRWVESVVVPAPARPERDVRPPGLRRAVVSLGGLLSPLLDDPSEYLSLVVPAALRALAAWGVTQVTLCGNLSAPLPDGLRDAAPQGMEVRGGALGHQGFLEAVAEADALLASPGLTTLLESSTRGVPVVCLPPQNISQILNATFYAQASGAPTAAWPDSVFRAQDVLDARLGDGGPTNDADTGTAIDTGIGTGTGTNTGTNTEQDNGGSPGEDAALELIYGGISRAAADPEPVRAALTARIGTCLAAVEAHAGHWTALARLVGTGGAAQVADAVLATARAGSARTSL